MRDPWEEEWFTSYSEYGGEDCMSAATGIVAQASAVGSRDNHLIASVDHANFPDREGRRSPRADSLATFMSSAPDLYRALSLFAQEECQCKGYIIPCKHDLARRALKKARGES